MHRFRTSHILDSNKRLIGNVLRASMSESEQQMHKVSMLATGTQNSFDWISLIFAIWMSYIVCNSRRPESPHFWFLVVYYLCRYHVLGSWMSMLPPRGFYILERGLGDLSTGSTSSLSFLLISPHLPVLPRIYPATSLRHVSRLKSLGANIRSTNRITASNRYLQHQLQRRLIQTEPATQVSTSQT